MVSVFIQVSGEALREGMYLEGDILSQLAQNGVVLPRRILLEGQRVYTIEEGIVKTQAVEVLSNQAEETLVTGLKDGTLISLTTNGLKTGETVILPAEGHTARPATTVKG